MNNTSNQFDWIHDDSVYCTNFELVLDLKDAKKKWFCLYYGKFIDSLSSIKTCDPNTCKHYILDNSTYTSNDLGVE